MPLTPAVKERLNAMLPPPEVTRTRLEDYLAKGDLTIAQFGNLCGYSRPAVQAFLSDRYVHVGRSTDVKIREAIEETIRRYPVGVPEVNADGHLYETENVADLRRWFLHCHEHRALAFCYGPPGSQKTFVLKHLVAEFNRAQLQLDQHNHAFYVRASVRMQPRDLIVKLAVACGATTGGTLQRCLGGVRRELASTQTLFVIDEAQHLSIDCLEALRELHDESPRIGCLLAGSHGLKKLFARRALELEQWNSRLEAGIELAGVSHERAAEIILAEMPHLRASQVQKLIAGAIVPDAYSSANREYLNVRRLFKNIKATQLAEITLAQQKGAAA